jgi:hypothetical protein
LLPFITPEDDFYLFWKYDLPAEQPIASLTLTIGAGPEARRVPWSEILALPTRRVPLTLTCGPPSGSGANSPP